MDLNNKIPGGQKNQVHYRKNYLDYRAIFEHRDVYNLINTTKSPVKFDDDSISQAQKQMKDIGISENDKIVVINLRDKKYLETVFPEKDFSYKTQNVDIKSYKKSINSLILKGYKVVRIGLYNEKEITIDSKNYIDLFYSNKRTDLLETFLISKCIFQIGSYSGGTTPCQFLFRKPTIITNQIPLIEAHTWSKTMHLTFKKIFDKKRNINLSTSEIFELLNTRFGYSLLNSVNDYRYGKNKENNFFNDYTKGDFEIIDCNEDEINEVVIEVSERIEKKFSKLNEHKTLNDKFIKIFKSNLERFPLLKKFHGRKIYCNISLYNLKQNPELLE